MKDITIWKDPDTVAITVPVLPTSVYHCELMTSEYVMLRFNSTEKLNTLDAGCYIEYDGKKWKAAERPTPVGKAAGGYSYEIQFHLWEEWKNRILTYSRQGRREMEWSMTQTPEYFMEIVIENLQAAGYIEGDWTYMVDGSLTEMKLVEFSGTDVISALTAIAQAWDVEWWVDGHAIRLGKCELGTPMTLKEGEHIKSISRSKAQDANYCTRLYAFGSTRNIGKDYRPSQNAGAVVQRRLMLPESVPYIDARSGMTQDTIVEGMMVFDDIYPRRIGTMSSVEPYEYPETADEAAWKAYRFKDAGIVFSKEYVLPEQELKITFQTGDLAGLEFSVIFNPDGLDEDDPDAQVWEIVRNDKYRVNLPNENFKPKDGDTYILSGYDVKMVNELLIPAAESELEARARQEIEKVIADASTYECEMEMIRCKGYVYDEEQNTLIKDKRLIIDYSLGQSISIVSDTYNLSGDIVSRIRAIEKRLDGLGMRYTIGASPSYSRIRAVEKSVVGGVAYEKTNLANGGRGGVYLIRKIDATKPTDTNTFSALRIVEEIGNAKTEIMAESESKFLRKDQNDETKHTLTMGGAVVNGNASVGSLDVYNSANISADAKIGGELEMGKGSSDELGFVKGFKGCAIYRDENGYHIQTDYLTVTKQMDVTSVEVQEVRHSQGQIMLTKANCIVDFVERADDGQSYRLYFRAKGTDGKAITNDWMVGDQAYCKTFNINVGLSDNFANQYYWRIVTVVSQEPYENEEGDKFHWIDVSNKAGEFDKAAFNTAPREGDSVVLLGYRGEDKTRQSATILGGAGDRFGLYMFKGINSFVLPEPVIQLSPEGVHITATTIHMEGEGGKSISLKEYIDQNSDSWLVIKGETDAEPSADDAFIAQCLDILGLETKFDMIGAFYLNTELRVWRFNDRLEWEEITDSNLLKILNEFYDQQELIEAITKDSYITTSEKVILQRQYERDMQSAETLNSLHLSVLKYIQEELLNEKDEDKIASLRELRTKLMNLRSEYNSALSSYNSMMNAILSESYWNLTCVLGKSGVTDSKYHYLEGLQPYMINETIKEWVARYEALQLALQEAKIDAIGGAAAEVSKEYIVNYVTEHIDDILSDTSGKYVEGMIKDYTDGKFVTKPVFDQTDERTLLLNQWVGTNATSFGSTGLSQHLNNLFVGTSTIKLDKDGNITNISKSGLVTSTDFAALTTRIEDAEGKMLTEADISAFAQRNEDGTWTSYATMSADKVFITSGSKKLGNYFSLDGDTGDVVMRDLFARNITVEGVINNLVTTVDANGTNKDLLIANGGGYDLDVLRCSNVVALKNVVGMNVSLPFYIEDGASYRSKTMYNTGEAHDITTQELFQLLGKEIYIYLDETCNTQIRLNSKAYTQRLDIDSRELYTLAMNDEHAIDDFAGDGNGAIQQGGTPCILRFKFAYGVLRQANGTDFNRHAFYWRADRLRVEFDNFWG